ncbi:hypothetical protein LINPERHAP1_LOCUS8735, partial [Linum perenne]
TVHSARVQANSILGETINLSDRNQKAERSSPIPRLVSPKLIYGFGETDELPGPTTLIPRPVSPKLILGFRRNHQVSPAQLG